MPSPTCLCAQPSPRTMDWVCNRRLPLAAPGTGTSNIGLPARRSGWRLGSTRQSAWRRSERLGTRRES